MKTDLERLREAALSGKYDHEPMTDREKEMVRICRENRTICNSFTALEREELTRIALKTIHGA